MPPATQGLSGSHPFPLCHRGLPRPVMAFVLHSEPHHRVRGGSPPSSKDLLGTHLCWGSYRERLTHCLSLPHAQVPGEAEHEDKRPTDPSQAGRTGSLSVRVPGQCSALVTALLRAMTKRLWFMGTHKPSQSSKSLVPMSLLRELVL